MYIVVVVSRETEIKSREESFVLLWDTRDTMIRLVDYTRALSIAPQPPIILVYYPDARIASMDSAGNNHGHRNRK